MYLLYSYKKACFGGGGGGGGALSHLQITHRPIVTKENHLYGVVCIYITPEYRLLGASCDTCNTISLSTIKYTDIYA